MQANTANSAKCKQATVITEAGCPALLPRGCRARCTNEGAASQQTHRQTRNNVLHLALYHEDWYRVCVSCPGTMPPPRIWKTCDIPGREASPAGSNQYRTSSGPILSHGW